MFDEWWENIETPKTSRCDAPACKKPLQNVCENTFAQFLDREKSEIPEYPQSLKKLVTVERTLGGGKSGAYLFVIKFAHKKIEKAFVLKLYATAYSPSGHVQDTRPFREVYTQCAMSGTAGYNCLVGFAHTAWENVEHMFGLTTGALYTPDLKRVDKLADGRMLNPLPTRVLFMISTFTQGEPLLNLNLVEHHAIMPGLVLNLLSTMQKAERRLGQFTHWDLHADNIFVDMGCSVRTALPLAYVTDFSASHLYAQLAKVQPEKMESFKTRVWEPLQQRWQAATKAGRQTGIWTLDMSGLDAQGYEKNFLGDVAQEFVEYSRRVIAYPNVTLIDFDLAYSNQFPKTEPVHTSKANSPLPIAERTLAWLFKWIPAPYVIHLLQVLSTLRPTLPKSTQSDILHVFVYMFVALVYWDLTEKQHPARLLQLTKNADLIMAQTKQMIKEVGKFSMGSLRSFFLDSIQKVLPISCRRPPMYCGLAPVLSMNYTQLSTMVVGLVQSCAQNPKKSVLCRLESVLQAAQRSWLSSEMDTKSLLQNIQGALLSINMQYFKQRKQFIRPDIMQILFKHYHTDAQLHLHVQVPWEEFTYPLNSLLRKYFSRYSLGHFDIALKLLDDTNVSINVKNGADLYVDIDTRMQLNIFGVTDRQGTKYDLKVSSEPVSFDLTKIATKIAELTLLNIRIKKIGTLMELYANFDIDVNILIPSLGGSFGTATIGLLRFILSFAILPENIVMKSRGKNVELIMSFPPSDEPLHPCLGLVTDLTNINMALNCLSSMFSMPTALSKLSSTMTVDTQALVQVFLNRIDASLMDMNDVVPPVEIWAMTWQPKFKFALLPYPDEDIQEALKAYLTTFNGSFKNEELPAVAQGLLQDWVLSPLSPWQAAAVDKKTFNLGYVKYLCSFLSTEKFEDAES